LTGQGNRIWPARNARINVLFFFKSKELMEISLPPLAGAPAASLSVSFTSSDETSQKDENIPDVFLVARQRDSFEYEM
jgi:hypothetical protein